jgi:hypothetical protein
MKLLIVLPIVCCCLCGCSNLTPVEWTYTPGQGWSGPHYHYDDNTDAAWMDKRTKEYEQKGQDAKTARANAYYDFVQANGRFPNP